MIFSETPSADELRLLLQRAEQECLDDSVIGRLRVILHFAEHSRSISETCRYFGISRSTFHRWIERFDPNNLRSLADRSHEPMIVRQSAVASDVVELVRRYRMRYPQMGKEKISELLLSDHAVELSASTVGRVIERECLYFGDTPFHWKKRLENQKHGVLPMAAMEPVSEPVLPIVEPLFAELAIETPHVPASVKVSVRPTQAWNWTNIGRFLVVSSVITNILFLGTIALLSLFEHSVSAEAPTQEIHSSAAQSSASENTRLQ